MAADQLGMLQEENQRLRKAVDELSILNELARVISSTMNLDNVIENVVKRSVRAVNGQQGMITLVDEQAPTEMKTLVRALDSTTTHKQFHLNQNILGWMMINKKPLLSNDIGNDSRFSGVKVEGDIKTLLCVPLLVKNKLVGILAIFNKRQNGEFSEDDKRLLSIIAAQSGQILENARLYEQERSLLVVQEQIRLASRIQLDLLPKAAPSIPGYDIAGRTMPAQMVGGDYYDFIHIDDARMACCLGDVSGKGLPASLLMANLQATLRAQSSVLPTAKDCISRSNQMLHQSTSDEKFATLFYGILNSQTNDFTFCNAGHDPPFLVSSSGESRRLKTGGIVLSMMESFPYSEETIALSPGDVLVMYSDGLTESMNADGGMFGEEKIATLLNQWKGTGSAEIVENMFAAVKEHAGATPQSDDLTMVVIRRL